MRKRGSDRRTYRDIFNIRDLPPGIKVLVTYTGIIALFYLVYLLVGAQKSISVVFGNFIYGAYATLIEVISLVLLLSIIYGLVRKHFWVFYVSLAWFSFGILNAVVSLLRFRSEFDVLRGMLFISSLVVIALNGIIVWYVYSEKEFFKIKHLNKQTRTKDKFFVYVISVFLVVSMLILATFGINFYSTTLKNTNSLVSQLKSAAIPELVCAQKMGSEKDLCYVIISVMNDGNEPSVCDNIESDFYKITCYRSLA